MGVVLADSLVLTDDPESTPWIGWHNVVTIANIDTTTEAAGFPATNMANPSTHLKWRGGVNTAGIEVITITLGGATPVSYLGIAKHNWGTQGFTITISDGSSPPLKMFTVDDDCPILLRFAEIMPSTLTITLATTTQSTDVPEAAVIYAGELLVLERSITLDPDHTPINMGRRSTIVNGMSESGNFLGRIVTNTFNESAASFEWFNPAWYRANFVPFVEASNETPFFFAWHPIEQPDEVGYVWMIEDAIAAVDPVTQRIAVQLKYRGITCEQ